MSVWHWNLYENFRKTPLRKILTSSCKRAISRITACGDRVIKHIRMQAGGEARLQGALPAPLLPLHSYSPVHQAVPRADQNGKQAYRTLAFFRWATELATFCYYLWFAYFVSEHSVLWHERDERENTQLMSFILYICTVLNGQIRMGRNYVQ